MMKGGGWGFTPSLLVILLQHFNEVILVHTLLDLQAPVFALGLQFGQGHLRVVDGVIIVLLTGLIQQRQNVILLCLFQNEVNEGLDLLGRQNLLLGDLQLQGQVLVGGVVGDADAPHALQGHGVHRRGVVGQLGGDGGIDWVRDDMTIMRT